MSKRQKLEEGFLPMMEEMEAEGALPHKKPKKRSGKRTYKGRKPSELGLLKKKWRKQISAGLSAARLAERSLASSECRQPRKISIEKK